MECNEHLSNMAKDMECSSSSFHPFLPLHFATKGQPTWAVVPAKPGCCLAFDTHDCNRKGLLLHPHKYSQYEKHMRRVVNDVRWGSKKTEDEVQNKCELSRLAAWPSAPSASSNGRKMHPSESMHDSWSLSLL